MKVDLLIDPIGELVESPDQNGPVRGSAMARVERITGGAIAVKDGKIVASGCRQEVLERVDADSDFRRIAASDLLVTAGLVDPHTHLVFGGNRADEFMMRCQGKGYAEIAASGGGIVASMRGTRDASLAELVNSGKERLARMLAHGTTTCEVKTGYGLDQESELRMLAAILELDSIQPVELVATFLPAHAVPPECSRCEYVSDIVENILPAAADMLAAKGLSAGDIFVDVFCDEGYFSLEDTRAIFEAARDLGMRLKVHADEFKSLGATRLATEFSAASADHLLAITDDDIERLSGSNTVAVLLPGTSFFLNLAEHAPARKLIEAGVAVAVGSDYNPGSCHIFSLPMVMGLSCLHLGLKVEEALTAMTTNAAYAIGRGERIGRLSEGYQADIVVWNVGRLEEIPYNMGWNPVHT
ncbi:MAG: imidazolonepropionase, partial [Candidatus Obscuribacterales bacterium]|nr:imidazolonepropionase [Candidatus Obscuribacterales bacterium]